MFPVPGCQEVALSSSLTVLGEERHFSLLCSTGDCLEGSGMAVPLVELTFVLY